MDIQTNNAPPSRIMGQANAESQGLDIVRVLWRWKFLPLLGAFIGMAFGYLYHTTLPPLFISTALIQVVSPVQPITRNHQFAGEDIMQINRADESLVIGSPRVVKMAAINLNTLEEKLLPQGFKAKYSNPDAMAAFIAGNRRLTVTPAAKDSNTSLMYVNFVCEDAKLSPLVVNAVVASYKEYLSEEYETVGAKVRALMTDAQERVTNSMKKVTERMRQAQDAVSVPVMWTEDGAAVNPYTTKVQQVDNRLATLAMEKNALKSKLERAESAQKAGLDPNAILLLLTDAEHIDLISNQNPINSALDATLAQQRLESERLELDELFRLQVEEKKFLSQVGESHPRLSTIRTQIELVKQKIESVRGRERAQQAELDEKLKAREEADNKIVPFKPLTAGERLAIRLDAMNQNQAALDSEIVGLEQMREGYESDSKELATAIQTVQDLNTELKQIQNLHEVTIEKLKQLELGPTASQRSVKELTISAGQDGVGQFYGPKLLPYLVGGGAVGFMLLAGLAVLLDLADKSFRSPDDIAAELGAPVLGHIPSMELDKVVKKPNQLVDGSLCTIHHSRGRVSEAYRSVRTGLFFSNRTGDLKVIQVTSPVPGDGKSTLSSNLAVTMAQSGRSVLLIDADFRRPRIAKLFNIESDNGMATVVAGACELDDAIHASSIPGLSIMPGGRRPSNPAELLSSQRFADLLGALREKFDVIIVDTPPLLAVSDPSAIAAVVDGVVLTIRLRRNVKPLVTRAARILESVDSKLLGIVVNGVSQDAGYGYNYGYRDYRYQYRYGSKGYTNKGYYGNNKYLEEAHDVDTDHVLVQGKDKPEQSDV